MRRSALAGLLAAACLVTHAQLVPEDPDWKEADAPKPPALKTTGLVPLEMPGSSLRWGVDPASVQVGSDGVVRYVVTAVSSDGAVNAFHEAVRCGTAEVKVYARHAKDGGWVQAQPAEWRPLFGNRAQRHSLVVAQQGACSGRTPLGTPAQIVRALSGGSSSGFVR